MRAEDFLENSTQVLVALLTHNSRERDALRESQAEDAVSGLDKEKLDAVGTAWHDVMVHEVRKHARRSM